jgi:holo-[acyl-carrier protein] synthase
MRIVGIGIDLVEVERVRGILERRSRFRERVFTPPEIEYCESRADPSGCYAARWAAREACLKALGGIRHYRWRDIRVERGPHGAPRLALEGSAGARAAEIGVTEVLVSFTHELSMAAAFCVAVAAGEGTA